MMIKRNKWTEEEIKIMLEFYVKGLSFVSNMIPNHTEGSIIKKAEKLKLKVEKCYYDVVLIRNTVKESFSFSEVFRKLNKSISGRSFNSLKRFINKNCIDISHFNPYKNTGGNNKKDINFWLIENSIINSNELKKKLYNEGLKERKCEMCGQTEIWNGRKMALILDHINGINNDNRLENLRIVCPNCNATLETHCKGYKGIKMSC